MEQLIPVEQARHASNILAYTGKMDEQDPITELCQLLVISGQKQLEVSRELLAAQKAQGEAMEASLRLNRRLLLAMTVLLVIVGGLNLYALWPSAWSEKRVIIIEGPAVEDVPAASADKQV